MATTRPALPRIDPLDWVPDTQDCMVCKNQFSCFFRRHHCRFCGVVVCGNCSGQTVDAQRACAKCYQKNELLQKRVHTLTSSPALTRVKNLSATVQFNDRKGTHSNVLSSPRISHSVKALETMYSPKLESKTSVHSPLLSSRKQKDIQPNDAMIVVDPFSTGAVLVGEILARGCKVIRVFSDEFPAHLLNLVLEGIRLEFVGTVQHRGDLPATVTALQDLAKTYNLRGCVAGCETGVEVADAIAEALGLRTNGTALSDCRRNKFLMQEQIRRKGVPAVLQARVSCLEHMENFLKNFGRTFKLVIKPVASAGTDHVYIVRNAEEARKRFGEIMESKNLLGKSNPESVLQQFLEGKEYVVDTVSLEGVHKCTAVWEYDKRRANDHDFVYFGCRIKSGDEPVAQELIKYQFKVLDALGIRNGAGHGEVMYTPDGPRLVEVGARCHGAEGNWVPLANKAYGYSQVKALADCQLDHEAFKAMPEYPLTRGAYAVKVDLVSYVSGKLKAMPRLPQVKALKSYFGHDILVKIGDKISPTIDCITTPGSIRLFGYDKVAVESDFLRIHEMCETDFFVVEGQEHLLDKIAKAEAKDDSAAEPEEQEPATWAEVAAPAKPAPVAAAAEPEEEEEEPAPVAAPAPAPAPAPKPASGAQSKKQKASKNKRK